MSKTRVLGEHMDYQRKWIRALLEEWGRWHVADQSLPRHARLRTPGDPVFSDQASIEMTHRSVIHVRSMSHAHYRVLQCCYEPPGMSNLELFQELKGPLGLGSISSLKAIRSEAEQMVANHRMGQSDALEIST